MTESERVLYKELFQNCPVPEAPQRETFTSDSLANEKALDRLMPVKKDKPKGPELDEDLL